MEFRGQILVHAGFLFISLVQLFKGNLRIGHDQLLLFLVCLEKVDTFGFLSLGSIHRLVVLVFGIDLVALGN